MIKMNAAFKVPTADDLGFHIYGGWGGKYYLRAYEHETTNPQLIFDQNLDSLIFCVVNRNGYPLNKHGDNFMPRFERPATCRLFFTLDDAKSVLNEIWCMDSLGD